MKRYAYLSQTNSDNTGGSNDNFVHNARSKYHRALLPGNEGFAALGLDAGIGDVVHSPMLPNHPIAILRLR